MLDAMHLIKSQKEISKKHEHPFICIFIPFVCYKYPIMSPLVCLKLPYVRNKGFTLIEMIIAVTIIGIMLALGAPGMKSIIQDHRISGQANDLVADLNTARSEAIKRGVNVTVCKQDSASTASQCNTTATAAWTAGRVIFLDSTAGTVGQVDAGELVIRNHQAQTNNITLTSSTVVAATGAPAATNSAANLVVFTSAGLTTIGSGNEAVMKFCDNRGVQKAITVRVNFTGRIRTDRTPPAACP